MMAPVPDLDGSRPVGCLIAHGSRSYLLLREHTPTGTIVLLAVDRHKVGRPSKFDLATCKVDDLRAVGPTYSVDRITRWPYGRRPPMWCADVYEAASRLSQ